MKLFLNENRVNLFNPLSAPNKKANEMVLFQLYEWINEIDVEDNDRVLLEARLEDFIKLHSGTSFVSLEDLEDEGDYLQKAKYMINIFIKSGWIFEESQGDGKYSINFYDHSYKIIEVLINIRDEKPDKYDRQLTSIRGYVERIKLGDIDAILDIQESIEELRKKLRSLHSNIQIYYTNIIDNKSEPELDNLVNDFIKYKDQIFDASYYKYKMEYQSNGSLKFIIGRLIEIKNIESSLYVKNYIKDTNIQYTEGLNYIESVFTNLISLLKDIERLNKSIDNKHQIYFSTTLNKLYYLVNRSSDIKGIINNLLSVLISNNVDNFNFINLFDVGHHSWDKLSSPKQAREKLIVEEIRPIEKISENIIDDYVARMHSDLQFSMTEINKYVLSLLKNEKKIKASNIIFDENNSYAKFMYMILYSNLGETDYTIKYTKEKVTANNIVFNDFIIYKRGE